MKKNDIVERVRNRITLSSKLKVLNEMAFINLLTRLGYREDKVWTDDEDERLSALLDFAEEHTKHQMTEIKSHIFKKIE